MGKKIVKKILKRKQTKRRLKKIVRNNNNANNTNNNVNNNNANNNVNNNTNTLRNQLIARSMMPTTFGYMPQQYGNINNERRIEQLKNDNQTIAHTLSNDKATIDSLTAENNKLKTDAERYKDDIKRITAEHDRVEHKVEMTNDKLQEANRKKLKTEHLTQHERILEQQLAEVDNDNDIIQTQKDVDTLEADVHAAKLANAQYKKEYNDNKMYQRYRELMTEHEILITENQGLALAMKDDAFINPNDALIAKNKQLESEKYKNELLRKQMQKQKELHDIAIQQQSALTDDDLDALTKQHAESMKELAAKEMNAREQIRKAQIPINEYNKKVEILNDISNKVIEAETHRDYLQEQASKLERIGKTKNKQTGEWVDAADGLNITTRKKVKNYAQAEVENMNNARRIDRANKILAYREDAYKNKLIADELNKGLSPDEQNDINKLVEVQEAANIAEQRTQAFRDYRKAQFNESKALSQQEYMKSAPYANDVRNIAQFEISTQNIKKHTEDTEALNAAIDAKNKARYEHDIVSKINTDGLPATQQIIFLESKEAQLLDMQNKKQAVITQIQTLANQYPDSWAQFTQLNPTVNNTSLEATENRQLPELNGILSDFVKFLEKYNPQYINQNNLPTFTPTQNQPQ